jgi:hypothetical protein
MTVESDALCAGVNLLEFHDWIGWSLMEAAGR